MSRIFNVLVSVIVLSAYFQCVSGFCNSREGSGTLSSERFPNSVAGSGIFNGGALGSGAFLGNTGNSGSSGNSGIGVDFSVSGTGNGNGFMNTRSTMANDGSVYGGGYITGTGNSASSWNNGYYENNAAYSGGSATSNGYYSNFGSSGGNMGYSQGDNRYNDGSYAQSGPTVINGGGETSQHGSHSNSGLMRKVASDIADTVVDAIEVGHSLLQRPYIRHSNVRYVHPGYVRQVVRVPTRVVTVHTGCYH